ncbi:MAG TPA: tetratricopeptide repeat protein [Patescibacteria group bacterium]|nr:tetratricopeptide repeat protein [Patescibacteria group bacterium]
MRSAAPRARRGAVSMVATLVWLAGAGLLRADATPAAAPGASRPQAAEPEVIRIAPGAGEAGDAAAPELLPSPAQGVNARQILSDLWFKYQGLRQRGAAKEAEALVTSALAFMQREGLRSAPEIAAAFLAEGRRARRDGDDSGAVESFQLSLRFDPDRADTHLALAAVLLGGTHELGEGLREMGRGARALLTDPESIFFLGGAILTILYLGACAGLGVGLLLIALRATRAFAHDLHERLTRRATASMAAPIAWAVVTLPLVLPIPFTWVLGLWAVLVFGYVHGADKVVVIAALGSLMLAGFFGAAVAWYVETATDPAASALLQAGRSGADLRSEDALKEASRAHPEDPIYPFLLAGAERIGGRFEEAMAMYQHVIEIDPRNARAMVNLGNLHALRQEFAVAQGLYKKAAETDPTLVLAHYDSHLAHLETFNMESADEELKRARQIDDGLTSRLVAQAEARGAARRMPQDCAIPPRELWTRAFQLRRPDARHSLLSSALRNPTAIGAFASLLAAFLIPGLFLAPRSGGAGLCRRCGRAFCRRCQMTTKHPEHCAQCVHLFIVRDGLAPAVRDRKMAQVVGYHRRTYLATRLLSLVLPGSGHVIGGRSLLGAFFLVGWGMAWTGLLLRSRLLVPPGFRQGTALTISLVMSLLLALITWLAANISRQQKAAV